MAALAPEIVARVIDHLPVARLAVIDGEGRPDAMPIVFARAGDYVFSPIDGKPKKHARLARLEHIRAHPAVTLTLDHYAEDWNELWWIRLEADARVAVGEHAYWDDAVSALRHKYPQYRATPLFIGDPTMVVMSWQTVRWWAAGGMLALEAWLARCETGEGAR